LETLQYHDPHTIGKTGSDQEHQQNGEDNKPGLAQGPLNALSVQLASGHVPAIGEQRLCRVEALGRCEGTGALSGDGRHLDAVAHVLGEVADDDGARARVRAEAQAELGVVGEAGDLVGENDAVEVVGRGRLPLDCEAGGAVGGEGERGGRVGGGVVEGFRLQDVGLGAAVVLFELEREKMR